MFNEKNAFRGPKGNSSPPLEKLLVGQKYAFTVNPVLQPEMLYKDTKEESVYKYLHFWYRRQYEYFHKWRRYITVVLFPESSPYGRMHFHGTIEINNITAFAQFIRELHADTHFEIDTISSDTEETYMEYCTKQASIWKSVFGDNIIGYPMMISSNRDTVEFEPKETPPTGKTRAKKQK